ncbi:MAG: ABC transporter ATP-binding protein [Chloroflexi bacterium]|nr:ABC transporter ATP-binding protein [Chloroflexota bacterium]
MTQGATGSDEVVLHPLPGAVAPAVELIGITKAFPGVVANNDIYLAAMSGEVLCLLGENGAGKSTLMSILSGMYRPDAGRIEVDGRPVTIGSPRHARDLGIGMVYQHLSLIPTLTVLENLMMGVNPGIALDRSGAIARLGELSSTLGVSVDPDIRAGALSLGQQQQVEIIKALWKGSRVLILDEPTSMLTPQGIAELQSVIAGLKGSGLAVIFITHKLHEATAIGDRVTILRQGRVVGSLTPEDLAGFNPDELQARVVTMMFGEAQAPDADIAELRERAASRVSTVDPSGEPMLELIDVSSAGSRGQHGIHHVSLEVRRGEVLGVAGVDGNGQRALAEVIAGQRRSIAGDVRLGGASIQGTSVSARQRLGLRYVTDDRLGEGVVASYAVSLNLVLKRIGQPPFWRGGRVDRRAITDAARVSIDAFDIRTPSTETRIGRLSGGNIQKALLARELSFEPRVVVFNKPTHGLDVRTIAAVRQRIRDLAGVGVAILVISTDLDELLDLADRVAVLDAGRISGVVETGPGAEARIGELIVGARSPSSAA